VLLCEGAVARHVDAHVDFCLALLGLEVLDVFENTGELGGEPA